MPKCKICNGCLDVYSDGEAMFYHCFLCNKFYDLKTRKEVQMFNKVFLVETGEDDFVITGNAFKSEKEVQDALCEVFPDRVFAVTEMDVSFSLSSLVRKIVGRL